MVPHLTHGGGRGWNSNGMTHRLPDFQTGPQPSARLGNAAAGDREQRASSNQSPKSKLGQCPWRRFVGMVVAGGHQYVAVITEEIAGQTWAWRRLFRSPG